MSSSRDTPRAIEDYDFSGKTIFPFVTHAMSGLGTTVQEYKQAAPNAEIGPGLAVRGEDVQDAQEVVSDWLRRIGLLKRAGGTRSSRAARAQSLSGAV